jgi:hypothetical protein
MAMAGMGWFSVVSQPHKVGYTALIPTDVEVSEWQHQPFIGR